jgi:hypothetical protein
MNLTFCGIRSTGLWRWYYWYNCQSWGHYPPSWLIYKQDVSETGFCIRLHVEFAQINLKENCIQSPIKSKLSYDRRSVDKSVLVSGHHLGSATNFSFSLRIIYSDLYVFLSMGRLLWREDGPVIYWCKCYWASTALSLSGSNRAVLETISYCLIWDWVSSRVRVSLRLTVRRSVCLGVEPRLGLMTR